MIVALGIVLIHAAAAVLLAWHYFRRYAVVRPPVGVMTLVDVGIMIGFIILVPYLYLLLPRWSITALLVLGALALLYFMLEPILPRPASWGVALLLVVADIGTAFWGGPMGTAFLVVNNIVLALMAVSITNQWAQSGMLARDAAILGGALVVYDFVATTVAGQMDAALNHVEGLPFAPFFAWPLGAGAWASLGLGDVLMAALFPLVLRKAYGRTAGAVAAVLSIAAIGTIMIVLFVTDRRISFPVMVVLGPLMLLQYLYWRHRGPERTTWQYLLAEPLAHRSSVPGTG